MALIVEDGTGKTDSQTYASEAELLAYATARGVTIAGTDTQLLLKAMDYIEQQIFIGYKLTRDQALQWPRANVEIDSYWIDTDEIPTLLKEAQIEYALSIDAGTDPSETIERQTKRERVDGAVEVEYMGSSIDSPYIKRAQQKLKKLLASGGSFQVVRA